MTFANTLVFQGVGINPLLEEVDHLDLGAENPVDLVVVEVQDLEVSTLINSNVNK